jgi:hypothetical protein
MRALEVMTTVIVATLSAAGARAQIEQPRYQIVDRLGTVEVRRYEARIAAEAVVGGKEEPARGDGFRLVAGYIFGGNTAPAQRSEKIAMTAPVAQQAADGGWRIQFFMPARYTMKTLPRPTDRRVRLVDLPAQTLAVLTFSGDNGPRAVSLRQERLAAALTHSAWRAVGQPQAWFYDPPWTLPFMRRNEVAVQVERR